MANQSTTFPKGWKITTLREVADIFDSKRIPLSSSERSKRKGPYPYYGASDIVDWIDDYIFDGEYLLISEDGENLNTRNTSIAFIAKGKFWVNNHAHVLKGKESHLNKYLSWYFSILDINPYISGAVQPKLSKTNLESIPILISQNQEEHRAIAAVLSSLDDKIELLREQNKTLEATAQAIFKEWFVNFNFPGSPGKMIDSELGEIPKGWRIGGLGDEVETVLGGTPSTEKKEYWKNGNIPWINSGKVNDFRIYEPTSYITERALNESAAKLMPKGTIVIAITGATLGQVSRLEIDSTGNQSVIGIIPNEKFSSVYLFYWMLENVSTIINTATGGAQQHINKNDVNGSDFIVPTNDILKKYYEGVNPMMEKISSNCFQIQTLSKLRDTLLPKLMKGEVRVEGFKE
ncbi:MAG: restriction endonuclease subunit S [Lutibacter sp.]|jgi:type I restriction enzyme S subunit